MGGRIIAGRSPAQHGADKAGALQSLALVLRAVAELPRDAHADPLVLIRPHVILSFTTHARLDERGWTFTERKRRGPRSPATPARAWADEQESKYRGAEGKLNHQQVTMPTMGRAASWFEDEQYTEVLLSVIYDLAIDKRRRASAILDRLARLKHRSPDPTTVREHLRLLAPD